MGSRRPDHPATTAARFPLEPVLELFDFAVATMRQNLRRRHPGETDAQIEGRLERWRLKQPQIDATPSPEAPAGG